MATEVIAALLQPVGNGVEVFGENRELAHWVEIGSRGHGYVMAFSSDVNASGMLIERSQVGAGVSGDDASTVGGGALALGWTR